MPAILFPDTTVRIIRRVYKKTNCPNCGTICKKHSEARRQLRDLGLRNPSVLEVVQSVHFCSKCQNYFKVSLEDIASPGALFTQAVKEKALASIFQDGLPIETVVLRMLRDFHVHIPRSTLYHWMGRVGEKSRAG